MAIVTGIQISQKATTHCRMGQSLRAHQNDPCPYKKGGIRYELSSSPKHSFLEGQCIFKGIELFDGRVPLPIPQLEKNEPDATGNYVSCPRTR